VRAALRKYNLPFAARDVANDPHHRAEMLFKSGQVLSPCVEINGQLLVDVSGAELEAYLLTHRLVQPTDCVATVPLDRGCGP